LFCAISVLILLWFVYEISSNTTEITTAEYARQDDLLIEQFQTVSLWKYCKSSVLETRMMKSFAKQFYLFQNGALKLFCSAPMLLQARGVWYRVLSRKVPNGMALKRIHITETTQCRLVLIMRIPYDISWYFIRINRQFR
jgi:hypothetical protein